MFSSNNSVFIDIVASVLSYAICHSVYELQQIIFVLAKGHFDMHLRRKIFHITVGLVFMLCWPMFSSGRLGAVLAGILPGVYTFRLMLIGIKKDDKLIEKLDGRYRDYRDILKAAMGYALGIFLASTFYWRNPIAIAAISNLCAGDGMADIVGRRFGSWKLPYNKNKSLVGSIGMTFAGFLASTWFMYYFSWFGYIKETPNMVLKLFIVSVASALVESHPLSTKIDDNLTVPLAAMLIGSFVF
ncbi:hypothetical protein ACJIZ3_018279 [Penstemon smallii]|uniref:Phosphatidate cytidylyltransferase n=1 Tax=Penstemon smallii TaxID=265156 RepID=A0ABD3SZB5_9LAMI